MMMRPIDSISSAQSFVGNTVCTYIQGLNVLPYAKLEALFGPRNAVLSMLCCDVYPQAVGHSIGPQLRAASRPLVCDALINE